MIKKNNVNHPYHRPNREVKYIKILIEELHKTKPNNTFKNILFYNYHAYILKNTYFTNAHVPRGAWERDDFGGNSIFGTLRFENS